MIERVGVLRGMGEEVCGDGGTEEMVRKKLPCGHAGVDTARRAGFLTRHAAKAKQR
jgi:hypothetical protein